MTKTRSKTPDELLQTLRESCFGLPAVEEKASHGSPSFFVRGKMFVSFASGYGRGPSAWCKCSAEHQQELVAGHPERYFVPPYVGVKGWVGVILDDRTDWDELAVILEAGWDAVAPKSAREAPVLPPPKASPKLGTTDAKLVAKVLSKIETMCRSLAPDVDVEVHGAGATFRVKKKPIAYLNDNHHNDGIVSVSVRCEVDEARALADEAPTRFYVPPYIGARGWVAIRLDTAKVDWADVEARLTRGFEAVVGTRGGGRSGTSGGARNKKPSAP